MASIIPRAMNMVVCRRPAAGHLRLAGHRLDGLRPDEGQTDGGADASETERKRSTQS